MMLWKNSEGSTTVPDPKGSLANDIHTFLCYRASQSKSSTRQPPFTTHVKCIVTYVYLNSVSCLILYTRLYTKLNLFEMLLYATFITTKASRSTV